MFRITRAIFEGGKTRNFPPSGKENPSRRPRRNAWNKGDKNGDREKGRKKEGVGMEEGSLDAVANRQIGFPTRFTGMQK